MRWPWERVPWGRAREAGVPEATAGAAGPVDGGPTAPSAMETSPSSSGLPAAWTRLPALQRSVADTTAVAPPAAFRASLTTHRNPSFLAPLGHLVDPDGPAGVVGGLASSVGGPLSYEGVDELRVPDRPAPPPAPAVQRRIATLRPETTPPPAAEPSATGRSSSEPTWTADLAEPAGENPVDLGAAEPVAPPGSAPSAPDALVVARSAMSASPAPASGTAQTLGSGPSQSVAVPDVSTPATPRSTAPTEVPSLALPVQRSPAAGVTQSAGGDPSGAAGESIPATLRPTPSSPDAVDESYGSAVADASPTTAPDEIVGLVADRAPHSPPSLTDDAGSSAAPTPDPVALPVPGGTPSGPTLQREFAERTSAAPASAPIAVSAPVAPPAPSVPAPGGLDDLGYPPLVARPVQRRLADDVSGPAATTPAAGTPAASAAPLSGFSAAISALQDTPVEPPATGAATTADDDSAAQHGPDLVVARRVAPDHTGQLPAAGVALQRLWAPTSTPVPPPQTLQRSLIAGSSPVAVLPAGSTSAAPGRAASGSAATVPSAPPAVQRLRYESPSAAPGGPPPVQRSTVTEPQPAPFPAQPLDDSEPETGLEITAAPLTPAPASAAWTPVALAPVASTGTGAPSVGGPAASAPTRSFPAVQRTVAATRSAASVLGGAGSHPQSAHLPALTAPPPPSGGDPALLVQRSVGAPSPSSSPTASVPATPVTPPGSADQPAMAVSSRTVGLAEMFALAAAQSPSASFSSGQHDASAPDGFTVQRSADTEVQRTVLDSTGSDAAGTTGGASSNTTTAAPGGPAAPAGPMSGAELEEMARRLYEPLSARLRAELWQDRERSGLLTDLRP